MHPEIRKFWEDAGHKLIGPSLIDTWEIHRGPGPFYLIDVVCHGNRHRINKEWYSEEEMLRIIRLKAFI
jgi:hypothetical protein